MGTRSGPAQWSIPIVVFRDCLWSQLSFGCPPPNKDSLYLTAPFVISIITIITATTSK